MKGWVMGCLSLLTMPIWAGTTGPEQLSQFARHRTVSGRFTQEQLLSNGQSQRLTGQIWLAQGKFRWEYVQPYRQTIVSNGQKVWFYDPDLNQVIIRSQKEAIGDKPALLLSDPRLAEKHFEIKSISSDEGGLSWLEARPKDKDQSTFSMVRMGFKNGLPVRWVFWDSFGRQTKIWFEEIKPGVSIPPDRFQFVLPSGAEVLSD